MWVWLTQVIDPDHSLRQAVARFLAWRVVEQLAPCSSDTGAFAKARKRLPENVLAQLTRRTGRELLMEAPVRWSWHARDVKLIDGSTASMPDTPANQRVYPQAGTQKAGVGFPIMRFVVLFSLAVGTVLNAAYGPYQGKHTGETALLRRLHDELDEGDVLLGDRYFCSFFEIALLQELGVDVVTWALKSLRCCRRFLDIRVPPGSGKKCRLPPSAWAKNLAYSPVQFLGSTSLLGQEFPQQCRGGVHIKAIGRGYPLLEKSLHSGSTLQSNQATSVVIFLVSIEQQTLAENLAEAVGPPGCTDHP